MPERHSQGGLKATGRRLERILGTAGEQARGFRDEGEARRFNRSGHRSNGGPGHQHLIWQDPPRNGIPFRPYVYRGTGYDQLTGEEAC